MSQPNPGAEHPEPDPLLLFSSELEKAQPGNTTPENSPDPVKTAAPPTAADADQSLRTRLERLERQVERDRVAINTLKLNLVTLVTTVDEIKRRSSRPMDKPKAAILPRRPVVRPRVIALFVLLVAGGAAMWGVISSAIDAIPDTPSGAAKAALDSAEGVPYTAEASLPVVQTPISDAPPEALQYVASVSPVPARDRPATPVRAAPADRQAREGPAPQPIGYVGTLTVDSDPPGEVFINRQSVGPTPLRLEKLRAGSHLIWIEREGYRRWTRVVPVPADRVSRVSAELDPLNR